MTKIYISPSQQPHNVGYGNYGTEQDRMFQLGLELKETLERCGNTVYIAKKGITYQAATKESNDLKCDLHLVLHSNAATGKARGTLSMYYSDNGKKLASALYNNLSAFTPTSDRGCYENKNLYELSNTEGVAAYMEIAFHDNKEDATMIMDNMEIISDLIAKGVCKYLGKPFIAKVVKSSIVTGTFFRVVTGSFEDRANADDRVAELKKSGFESFITVYKK